MFRAHVTSRVMPALVNLSPSWVLDKELMKGRKEGPLGGTLSLIPPF